MYLPAVEGCYTVESATVTAKHQAAASEDSLKHNSRGHRNKGKKLVTFGNLKYAGSSRGIPSPAQPVLK